MAAEPVQVGTQRASRPVAVSIVAALALVFGSYLAVTAALVLAGADGDRSEVVDGLVSLGLAGLALLIAVGAFGVRRWAWVVFMCWAVVTLTLQLLRVLFYGDAHYARLVLGTVAVFLLTPLDTQVAFGIRNPSNARIDTRPGNSLDGH